MSRLVTVFGPKLAGKSTVSRELCEQLPGSQVLDCNKPETWEDVALYDQLQREIYPTGTSKETLRLLHFQETYKAAGSLLRGTDMLIVDDAPCIGQVSDFVLSMGAQELHILRGVHEAYDSVADQYLEATPARLALYVTVGGETPYSRAQTLAERLPQIEGHALSDQQLAEFHADQSRTILAMDTVEAYMEEAGLPVFRINTNDPYNIAALAEDIQAYA